MYILNLGKTFFLLGSFWIASQKEWIRYKYGIPILRMKTTGSNEEMRLRKKLLELLTVNKIITENTI